MGDIAAGAQEQSTALQEINSAIEQMNLVTQQNAAMVEQSTAAGHSLSEEGSTRLAQLVGQFQVGRAAGDEALRDELMAVAPHAFRERDKAPRASAPASFAVSDARRASSPGARQSRERRCRQRVGRVLRRLGRAHHVAEALTPTARLRGWALRSRLRHDAATHSSR